VRFMKSNKSNKTMIISKMGKRCSYPTRATRFKGLGRL
jgi:hypothetical protein